MTTLVFFLEEPSAKAMLEQILPRLLPQPHFIKTQYIVFEGKQDLERQLLKRLRGWVEPDSRFLIMRDQDSGDCRIIKNRLLQICHQTGKKPVLVRIACRELESFYLGDLAAVEEGLQLINLAREQTTRKFRAPDALGNPSEELKKITQSRYQKINGSRAIAPHLHLDGRNTSTSFNQLIGGIQKLINQQVELQYEH